MNEHTQLPAHELDCVGTNGVFFAHNVQPIVEFHMIKIICKQSYILLAALRQLSSFACQRYQSSFYCMIL